MKKNNIKLATFKYKESPYNYNNLERAILSDSKCDSFVLLNYPSVYVHVWQNKKDAKEGTYNVYIGETIDIVRRTKEHYQEGRDEFKGILKKENIKEEDKILNKTYDLAFSKIDKDKVWQSKLYCQRDQKGDVIEPNLYIFSSEYFNNSTTKDIEDNLISYCKTCTSITLNNGRGNKQEKYYGEEFKNAYLSEIWKKLRHIDSKVFISEQEIKDSAVFKASPLTELTQEQLDAKRMILNRVYDSLNLVKTTDENEHQVIFIEGEAGTGKTVLTNSTYFELVNNEDLDNLKCYLVNAHKEQADLCKKIAYVFNFPEGNIVTPSRFLTLTNKKGLKEFDENKIADVVFIDESHLLYSQNARSYAKAYKNRQLEEIIRRSKVTVILFDSHQFLNKNQFFLSNRMDKLINLAKSQNYDEQTGSSNYMRLSKQLRISCSEETMNWIDDLTLSLNVNQLVLDSKHEDDEGYEIKIFDSPFELKKAIIAKNKDKKSNKKVSRIIATYDWKYGSAKKSPHKMYCVKIGKFEMPWNYEYKRVVLKNDSDRKKEYKLESKKNWVEADYSINEIGSTFTIQGFDLYYTGVILGPSIVYRDGKIQFKKCEERYPQMVGEVTIKNENGTNIKVDVSEKLSMNEFRVLMTRGTKGLYIYACDDELREALKNSIKLK